nr:MAG TPA: Head Tail Connector Protein [Caudoviricetes sp.]
MYLLSYLTFEQYQQLGGKCTEDAFPNLQFDTETKMDYITDGRLSKLMATLEEVPEVVQRLEVKLIDIIMSIDTSKQGVGNVTSYSNGIESFGYATDKDSEEYIWNKFKNIMLEYLYPKYPQLFYRGRWVYKRGWNDNTTE